MAQPYKFLLNGADVCGLGLESAMMSLRAGGPDTLVWVYSRDPSGAAPFAGHDVVTVTCQSFDDEGELTETETLFKGRVVKRPVRDEGGAGGWTITAESAWGDLRRIVLTQSWKSWNPATETLVDMEVPRVVLGISSTGTIQTTGATLKEIVTHAAAKGALIAAGTISPSLTVPPTELVDTVCDTALRQILAYHPDHVAWIEDGESLHVRPPSALATITVDPCAEGMEVDHDPQTAEIPGGVTIVWERTHEVDGEAKIERIHQSAGATSGWPPPLLMTIPLAGTSVTTKTQVIETRTLPVPGETSATLAKNFLKGIVPQLADAANADLLITAYEVEFADPRLDEMDDEMDDTVNPNSKPINRESDEVEDFPRMLVGGQVQPWFPSSVKQYDALLNVSIRYNGNDAKVRQFAGKGLEISEPITITNALPRTYSVGEEITAAESPIEGLAASYFSAISGARDEGAIRADLMGQWRDLRPGRRVVVTGKFSTPSPIISADYDLLSQTVSAGFGAGEYLNPKSIAELAKAMAKNRPSWRRPEERTKASGEGASGGSIREGGKAPNQYPTVHRSEVKLWDLEVTNADTSEVKIRNPGRIRKTMAMDHTGDVGITNAGATFTAGPGKMLVLEYTPELDIVLQMVDEWDGWPMPIDSVESDPPGLWLMEKGYFVLWDFMTSSEDPAAVRIGDELFGERRAYDSHLIFGKSWMEDKDGRVVPIYELLPAQGFRAAV